MRYSDDFIVILPDININKFENISYTINETYVKSIPNLILHPDKCQIYNIEENNVYRYKNNELDKSHKYKVNYLGFSYDGQTIDLRDRTKSKYYSKMSNAITSIRLRGGKAFNGYRIPRYKEYERFTYKGMKGYKKQNDDKVYGNFHDYVARSQAVFKEHKKISRITAVSMKQIRKRFNKIDRIN